MCRRVALAIACIVISGCLVIVYAHVRTSVDRTRAQNCVLSSLQPGQTAEAQLRFFGECQEINRRGFP
jgi:hypothetical protein